MHETDHYSTLGIKHEATPREIKQAYRKLVKINHPDRHEGNKTQSLHFHLIQRAYETLNNPGRRTEYDRWLMLQNQSDSVSGNVEQTFSASTAENPRATAGQNPTGGVYSHDDVEGGNLLGIRTGHVLLLCFFLWVIFYLGWRGFRNQVDRFPSAEKPRLEKVGGGGQVHP